MNKVQIFEVLEDILKTKGEELISAKQAFMSLTGKVDESSSEYEARMNSFNDWYIFDYNKIFEDYFYSKDLDIDILKSFYDVRYSVFKVTQVKKDSYILHDLFANEKIVINKEHSLATLVENDIFCARILNYKNENYLLRGICLLPFEIETELLKFAKNFRKNRLYYREKEIVLRLEEFKMRSLNYKHVSSSKIFDFKSLLVE
ncbi:MAG: hypothetical protein N4A33_07325 [Bacteriovoracaceae bacterium]|jgi:hypothetical protein|nr:hypothetical protein [Bacteriovoracaceae bacterium]